MKNYFYPLLILLALSFSYNLCTAAKGDLKLKATTADGGSAVLLQMSLYRIYPNKNVAVDGTITQYGDDYSNKIDRYDARKMSVPGENISLFRHDTDLVVERRQTIQSTDTIFFRMWKMQQTNYSMVIVPANLNNGLNAYLIDNYLHTSQALNLADTTKIPFTVTTDAASYDQFRFKIIFSVFQKQPPIPFSFVSSEAVNQHSQVLINWETTNEMNLVNYQVQRSVDKINYQPIATVDAMNSGTNNYKWADRNPLTENSFYRIRGVEANGTSSYSEVLKVMNPKVSGGISIYPNPVVGNTINLKLNNQETGTYKVNVSNSFGAVVLTYEFNVSTANAFVKIPVDKTISKGVYYLEITGPSGNKQLMNIVF